IAEVTKVPGTSREGGAAILIVAALIQDNSIWERAAEKSHFHFGRRDFISRYFAFFVKIRHIPLIGLTLATTRLTFVVVLLCTYYGSYLATDAERRSQVLKGHSTEVRVI